MKLNTLLTKAAVAPLILGTGLFLAACDVDKVEEGKMPEVDVDVEEGKLPKYDIDGPDVDVGSKKVEVEVPTIDVDLPEDGDEGDGDEDPKDLEE